VEKHLTIELPEASVDAYLRLVAWWCDFRIVAHETPVFRDVAESRGIEISTSDAERLFLGLISASTTACAEAVVEGRGTVTPSLALPLHVWHVGARTAVASIEATNELVASGRLRPLDPDAQEIRLGFYRAISAALGHERSDTAG